MEHLVCHFQNGKARPDRTTGFGDIPENVCLRIAVETPPIVKFEKTGILQFSHWPSVNFAPQ